MSKTCLSASYFIFDLCISSRRASRVVGPAPLTFAGEGMTRRESARSAYRVRRLLDAGVVDVVLLPLYRRS